jgi:NADPH:quinone reductase-like Zn-dependent oxidoreductase
VLRADQPEGLDTVLELLDSSATAMDLCKAGGTAVYMNDFPPDLADASARGVNAQWLHHRADGTTLRDLLRRYADGVVPMPHIEVMPLDRAADAHRKIQTGRTKGKIVLRVERH